MRWDPALGAEEIEEEEDRKNSWIYSIILTWLERCSSGLLLVIVLLYIVLAPFTKVEESFNVQATHDLMFHKTDINEYDHKEFPGVVPRTFLGPIVLSMLSFPIVSLAMVVLGMTKLVGLYAVRAAMGLLSVHSFWTLQSSIKRQFGGPVGTMFIVFTAFQFHLPFYMSRLLPNTYALILSNLAFSWWIDPLHMLLVGDISLMSVILTGLISGSVGLCLSTAVDSWFWGKLLWPEGQVFYFNVILNKSEQWGVFPFSWYWVSALPRTLLSAYPLSLIAPAEDRRARPLMFVALLFVFLYSNLGHKETRFLFPVLPLFNICAAVSAVRLVGSAWRNIGRFLVACLVIMSVVVMAVVSGICLWGSMHNYPGGVALQRLHAMENFSKWHVEQQPPHQAANLSVHIDVFPAMTGVTRFGELGDPWQYSKVEGLSLRGYRTRFTHLLTTHQKVPGFTKVASIQGFAGFHMLQDLQSIRSALKSGNLKSSVVRLTDQVFIHKRGPSEVNQSHESKDSPSAASHSDAKVD